MWRTRLVTAAVLSFLALATSPATGHGQIGSIRKKAEEAKKKLEDAAKKTDSAKARPDTAKAKADSAKAAPAASAKPLRRRAAPTPKVWENYDFVPGNKVLFYTDFSEDRVGNFARGLQVPRGPNGDRRAGRCEDVAGDRAGRVARSPRQKAAAEVHVGDRHPYSGERVAGRPSARGGWQDTRPG